MVPEGGAYPRVEVILVWLSNAFCDITKGKWFLNSGASKRSKGWTNTLSFYLVGLIEIRNLLEISGSIFRPQHARANITGAQKKCIRLLSINESLNIFSASLPNYVPTYFTNQVGQPSDGSLCRSRSGTMFNSSTRLTTARGTWTTGAKKHWWDVCVVMIAVLRLHNRVQG